MESSVVLFQILISPPCAHQHKSTYGLALDYPSYGKYQGSFSLGGKKKAGVSAGMKSEASDQQQMQKRG